MEKKISAKYILTSQGNKNWIWNKDINNRDILAFPLPLKACARRRCWERVSVFASQACLIVAFCFLFCASRVRCLSTALFAVLMARANSEKGYTNLQTASYSHSIPEMHFATVYNWRLTLHNILRRPEEEYRPNAQCLIISIPWNIWSTTV